MAARKKKLTLGRLRDLFLEFLSFQQSIGQTRPKTVEYYRHQLDCFVAAAGVELPVEQLTRIEIQRHARTWHRIQSVQRMCHWAMDQEPPLIDVDPTRKIQRPRLRRRTRILTEAESVMMRRRAHRPFRDFLLCAEYTAARPGEIRRLKWDDIRAVGNGLAFVLSEFKAQDKMQGDVPVRTIPIPKRLLRLLERLRRREDKDPDGIIFLNRNRRPWTANAVRCGVRKLRELLGLFGSGRNAVVCYSFRHTGATRALRNREDLHLVSKWLGHRKVATTQIYDHLENSAIVDPIENFVRKQRRKKEDRGQKP